MINKQYIEEKVKEFRCKGGFDNIPLDDACNWLRTALTTALEERDREMVVSWDIADGGDNWVVQFWRIEKDGTKTLVQQLDKNSDDGGSFALTNIKALLTPRE